MTIRLPIRSPSVDSLRKKLKIDLAHAQLIKMACNHGKPQTALKLANEAMNGHGVESLYPDVPYIYYVNMGDTYSRTLVYNSKNEYMWIGSWGDWYERSREYARHVSSERRYLKKHR